MRYSAILILSLVCCIVTAGCGGDYAYDLKRSLVEECTDEAYASYFNKTFASRYEDEPCLIRNFIEMATSGREMTLAELIFFFVDKQYVASVSREYEDYQASGASAP